MARLPAPPDGVVTRSGYWFEIAMCIMPSTMRYERIIDAADDARSGVKVTYNYPRPVALMPQLFGECTPKRLLREGTSSLVQQYCTVCHWLTIALFGPKMRALLFRPTQQCIATSKSGLACVDGSSRKFWPWVGCCANCRSVPD